MGFRSTFVTEDVGIDWPSWLREKYAKSVNFGPSGVLSAKIEGKTEGLFFALAEDVQSAINWADYGRVAFVLVYLHECGGITRVQIEKDAIKYSEPTEWWQTDGVTHHYCYGCSDAPGEPQ